MFEKDRFIESCIKAAPEGQDALRDVVAQAVSDSAAVRDAFGPPEHAGITPLYRSPDLTIINFIWAPYMSLMPHNHQMFAVIGIYSGREDNIFWRRTMSRIEAVQAKTLGSGEVALLDRDIIHSVLNPIGKMTSAIHVYGGDFFAPPVARSQWDHESLAEGPFDIDKVKAVFRDAELRSRVTQS